MQSRRTFLKVLAGAPLIFTFGLVASPLMRFLKPTMKPFGFFDPADFPKGTGDANFVLSDLPEAWACLPFLFHESVPEFNAERREIRSVPGFLIRLPNDEVVAYSRVCPKGGCMLDYVRYPKHGCGCAANVAHKKCCCAIDVGNPVLLCRRDGSVFDLANDARVIFGPAPRPARMFDMNRQGDRIAIIAIERPIR